MSTGKQDLENDIENRLDEFFEDGESSQKPLASSGSAKNSLQKLKSVILSIDWEITDECLSDLVDETQKLLPVYENDRYISAMLRMLQSLGRYIRRRKAQAHQDAIRRIMAAFDGVERLIGDADLSEESKIHIVAKEIAAFKRLKEQVEARKALSPSTQPGKKTGVSKAFVNQDHFEEAMNAVEKRFDEEVKALKIQLEMMQKELKQLR